MMVYLTGEEIPYGLFWLMSRNWLGLTIVSVIRVPDSGLDKRIESPPRKTLELILLLTERMMSLELGQCSCMALLMPLKWWLMPTSSCSNMFFICPSEVPSLYTITFWGYTLLMLKNLYRLCLVISNILFSAYCTSFIISVSLWYLAKLRSIVARSPTTVIFLNF